MVGKVTNTRPDVRLQARAGRPTCVITAQMTPSRSSLRRLLALGLLGLLPACGSAESAPLTATINGVNEAASTGGWRYVELYGSFPQKYGTPCNTAPPWLVTHSSCYAVETYCNGALIPTYINYYSTGQINVSFWELPSDTRCTFTTKALWAGDPGETRSNTSSVEPLNPPHLQIFGVNDVGITSGRHYYEIYYQSDTYIPNPSTGGVLVGIYCDGGSAFLGTVMLGATQLQINVNFSDVGLPRSCGFYLGRTADGHYSPVWRQQVNTRPALDSKIGAYHWGGYIPDYHKRLDSLKYGVRSLRDTGLRGPIRIVMDPKQNVPLGMPNNNYNIAPLPTGQAYDLARAAELPQYQNAFAEAGHGARFVITALDGAANGNLSLMSNPTIQALVEDEYYRLALTLFRTQAGSNREFIISNWEGDNLLFGYGGAENITVPREYVARWGTHAPTTIRSTIRDRRIALTTWFQLRKQGIDRARVAAAGVYPNVFVNDAIEFSVFRIVQEGILGLPINQFNLCPTSPAGCAIPDEQDMLRGIVPVVRPKYAFFSAWETVNAGRVDEELKTIADFLSPMGITLAVGEWGRQQSNDDMPNVFGQWNDWLLKETTVAMRRAPISAAVTWEGFTSVDLQDGLLSIEGLETKSMRALHAGIGAAADGPTVDFAIRAVQESYAPYDRFVVTFYGAFPNPTSSIDVYAKCGDETWILGSTFTRTTTLFQTAFINPSPAMNRGRFCVFKLAAPGRSRQIGPYQLCPTERGQPGWQTNGQLCPNRGF